MTKMTHESDRGGGMSWKKRGRTPHGRKWHAWLRREPEWEGTLRRSHCGLWVTPDAAEVAFDPGAENACQRCARIDRRHLAEVLALEDELSRRPPVYELREAA
jgi:hypothetical protein